MTGYADHEPEPGRCANDVHGAFGLTYASYLVLPRSLLQEMPPDWQHRWARLLDDFYEAFPGSTGEYSVVMRDPVRRNRFVVDPLRAYRHPNYGAIAAARSRA